MLLSIPPKWCTTVILGKYFSPLIRATIESFDVTIMTNVPLTKI